MDISIIIVNFKSRQFLPGCLSSLQAHFAGIDTETIIVNNDEELIDDFSGEKEIRILNMPANLGFARACNTGANIANGKFLFFLNPDAEITKLDSEKLFQKLALPETGIVAPKILLPNGEIQPWSCGNKLGFFNLIKNNLGLTKDVSIENKSDFDWVTGAALLISKDLFIKNKGFDENFFMYFEDMDFCLRIKESGYKINRINDFSITHLGGQSYQDRKLQKKHYYKSQDYYFKKHSGFPISAAVKIFRKLFLLFK